MLGALQRLRAGDEAAPAAARGKRDDLVSQEPQIAPPRRVLVGRRGDQEIVREHPQPTQKRSRNARSCRPSVTRVCVRPASVPHRAGSMGASCLDSAEDRRVSGDEVEFDASVACLAHPARAMCRLVPPPPTSLFFRPCRKGEHQLALVDQSAQLTLLPATPLAGRECAAGSPSRHPSCSCYRAHITPANSGSSGSGSAHRGSARRWPSRMSRRRSPADHMRHSSAAVLRRRDRARTTRPRQTRRAADHRVRDPARAIRVEPSPGDPRRMRHGGRDVAEQQRRIGVFRCGTTSMSRPRASTAKAPQCELCGEPRFPLPPLMPAWSG